MTLNEVKRSQHERHIKNFLGRVVSYPALNWEVELNDDSDPQFTAYLVTITNIRNDRTSCLVLRSNSEDLEVLKGEDFFETDDVDFWACLYINTIID